MGRTIVHLDLDAFFCAVEEQRDPALKGQPFAVGGTPDQRGVVASCSYPARAFGIHSAMPMHRARQLCPDLIIVGRHHADYSAVSRQVMALLHDVTDQIEQLSIDEAFLDATHYVDPPATVAGALQARIRDELGLPCSLGVASNKLVAKIANNIGKSQAQGTDYPNAITVVSPGDEAAFLAPLPVRELWGVGPKTAEKLAALGLHTIGDIAAYPADTLAHTFGKHGADLAQRARGLDDRPIVTQREIKSISRETTFPHDVRDLLTLKRTLWGLCRSVGGRLRKKGLQGSTIKLKLRWADFTTLTRQVTVPHPIDEDIPIYAEALGLLMAHRPPSQYVRLIGVGVSGFDAPAEDGLIYHQLSFWEVFPDAR